MLFLYLSPEGICQPKVCNQYCVMIRPWRRSVMQDHLSSPSLFCSLPWIPYPRRHRSTDPRCPPQRPSQARQQRRHTRRARSSGEGSGWSMTRPAASWRSWGTRWRSSCWLWSCWRLSKCNKTCFEHSDYIRIYVGTSPSVYGQRNYLTQKFHYFLSLFSWKCPQLTVMYTYMHHGWGHICVFLSAGES